MQARYIIIAVLVAVMVLAVTVPASAASSYPMTVTDNYGRTITLAHAPQRIVSLSAANTEILFALGAGHRIVGNTEFDDYPQEALNITHVGGFSDLLNGLNKESIVNVTPDLIIAEDTISEKATSQLVAMGYPVIVLTNHNISMIENNIRLLGKVTDTEDNASAVVNNMEAGFNSIRAKTANLTDGQRPLVLFLAGYMKDSEIYVYGSDTFGDELIRMAGGKNMVNQTGYPVISTEAIIKEDPDCIIIPVADDMCSEADFNYFKNGSDSRFKDTFAVKNGSVFRASALVMHPGPRLPAAAIEIEKIVGSAKARSHSTTPGFEAVIGLVGLLGAACLLVAKKR